MKKVMLYALAGTLVMSSCGTATTSGTYMGASLGSILGSAIGGISDGPRGSDLGTIIGMVGGAAVGAAIGQSVDKREADEMNSIARERADRLEQRRADEARQSARYGDTDGDYGYGSGFNAEGGGDDRLYDFQGSDYSDNYSAQPGTTLPHDSRVEVIDGLKYEPQLEIRNVRFVDEDGDRAISRGEVCKVIFEVMNRSGETLYDLQPMVVNASGTKNVYISPGVHVEKILPGKGIRYTAVVKGGDRLRDGRLKLLVSVQGVNTTSKTAEFNITTKK